MIEGQGEVKPRGGGRSLVGIVAGGIALLACVICALIAIGGGVAVTTGSARVQGLLEKWGLGFATRQLGVAEEATQPPAAEFPSTAEMPAEQAQPTPLPTATPTPEPTPLQSLLADTDLPVLLEQGAIAVESVDSSGMGILGTEVLIVNLYNPSDKDMLVTIPPGYVFLPPTGSGEQRMMVLQTVSVTVPAGGYASVSPYVTCIDSDLAAPSEGSVYQAGGMVEDERLREFALCVSQQELPVVNFQTFEGFDEETFARYMSLQLAVWSVAEGQNFAELFAEAGAEYGSAAEALGELSIWFEGIQIWLDACNVQFDQ